MKNNRGFSLVELIVVIAIMAILAAVAVIGVSVYIPRAQKAADAELVNDIIYAVTLRDYETQFASNGNGVIGYVVVTEDGNAFATEGDIHEAMVAAFGANYAEELRLSYDGWTDAKVILNQVSDPNVKDFIVSVNQSTYITDIGTDKLLGDVQHCATSFGTFLSNLHSGNNANATNTMINKFEDQEMVKDLLEKAGYPEGQYDKVSKEVLQNVTVFAVASEVKDNPENIVIGFADKSIWNKPLSHSNNLDEIANWYAAAEALINALDDTRCDAAFASIDLGCGDAIQIADEMKGVRTYVNELLDDMGEENDKLREKFNEYYDGSSGKSQAQKDGEAYVAIMTTVNNLDDEYLEDKKSIQNTNLFDGGSLNNRVDTYISAAQLAGDSDMLEAIRAQLPDGKSAVVILVCERNGALDFMLLPAGVIAE